MSAPTAMSSRGAIRSRFFILPIRNSIHEFSVPADRAEQGPNFYWTRKFHGEMTQSAHFLFVLTFSREQLFLRSDFWQSSSFSLCILQKKIQWMKPRVLFFRLTKVHWIRVPPAFTWRWASGGCL